MQVEVAWVVLELASNPKCQDSSLIITSFACKCSIVTKSIHAIVIASSNNYNPNNNVKKEKKEQNEEEEEEK